MDNFKDKAASKYLTVLSINIIIKIFLNANNFKINSHFTSLNKEEKKELWEKWKIWAAWEREAESIGLKCFRVSCVTRSLNLIVSGLFFSKRRGKGRGGRWILFSGDPPLPPLDLLTKQSLHLGRSKGNAT